uniref:RDD domain-containing protein n=1 Tax=viral metagenome TaxID=1070528 RepID=A0A6C0HSL2_9ZZZZ
MLCKYKDILGKVGEGVHSYRIFNIAVIDVLLTIFIAFIIHKVFQINFIVTLISFFLLGILFHRLFCVQTTLDKLLFN